MTFWGHLEALRWVLIRVVAVLFLFMVVCFCAMPYLFDHIVLAPTTADFPLYRWLSKLGSLGPFFPDFSDDNYHVEIININVASQFLTHISTSFWFALVLMFPYLVFEIWRFVQPALFDDEKKNVGWAFVFGTGMFFLGCAVGYCLVFPFTFRFPHGIPAQHDDRQSDFADLLYGQLPDAHIHHGNRLRTAAAGVASLQDGTRHQVVLQEIPAARRRRPAGALGHHHPFGRSVHANDRLPAAVPALRAWASSSRGTRRPTRPDAEPVHRAERHAAVHTHGRQIPARTTIRPT